MTKRLEDLYESLSAEERDAFARFLRRRGYGLVRFEHKVVRAVLEGSGVIIGDKWHSSLEKAFGDLLEGLSEEGFSLHSIEKVEERDWLFFMVRK